MERIRGALQRLRQACEHVYVTLFTGCVMLGTGVNEIIQTIEEPFLGSHFGVALFGFIQVTRGFPMLLDGRQKLKEPNE